MTRPLLQALGLDGPAIAYGVRMAFAAWLAFAIAASLHVENAYWAAMPIWVVAQSSRGLLLERAFFRIAGTLVGAGAGFAILHVPAPLTLQLGLLALWVALCAAFTHILRGVHSYGALLSGLTAGVVVIPSLLAPGHSFDVALARVECTLIGVVVVTLVTGLFTPSSRREAFYQAVRRLAGDAVAFAADAVSGSSLEHSDALERRILAEVSDVDARSRMVSAGSVEGYRRIKHVDGLIASTLAVMAAGRALRARAWRGEDLPPELGADLRRIAEWFQTPTEALWSPGRARKLPEWTPALERLSNALEQLVTAEARLFSATAAADARSFGKKAFYLAPHRDWGLARDTGLLCGAATFLMTSLALVSTWPAGELAALGVCIFSMVLGSMQKPQEIAPKLLTGVLFGVVAATCFRLILQPHLTSTALLIVALAPFFLLGGLAKAGKYSAIAAVDANMCFLLGSQAGMPALPPAEVLNNSAALVLGAGLMSLGFIYMPRRFDRYAAEAAGFIRADLRRLIAGTAPETPGTWHSRTSRQILRLMLHLGRAGELGPSAPPGLLAALNLGHAVSDLREVAVRADLTPSQQQLIDETWCLLRRFEEDPLEVANELAPLAARIGEDAVARALMDTADALHGLADLLAFGCAQEAVASR
ncbi:MAG TPA: FUSC family protein [Stenomitos sp.]